MYLEEETQMTRRNAKPTKTQQQAPTVFVASDSPFMRIREAAAYLRVAPWAIGAAIREGKLAHSVIGKRYIIRREDLDIFAAQNRVAA
jgi:excisionase family DNA binding protein